MITLKTKRGQSARIIENENNFKIELYSNGNWHAPYNYYNKNFNSEREALNYFEGVKSEIHS